LEMALWTRVRAHHSVDGLVHLEEEQTTGSLVRGTVGFIRAAIVRVEYAPGLEVCNESFNGSTQRGYDCVIFFVALC
jgi:hypothetical protein